MKEKSVVVHTENYKGYQIRVVELIGGDFSGMLEAEVNNDEIEETWHYDVFDKSDLEKQLSSCRNEIDEDIEITFEMESDEDD